MSRTTNRRRFLSTFSFIGLAGLPFAESMWELACQEKEITREVISSAGAVAGLSFTSEETDLMLGEIKEAHGTFARLRQVEISSRVAPAFVFLPDSGRAATATRAPGTIPAVAAPLIKDEGDLAFASVRQLGALLRARKTTAVDLARHSIRRLKKFDPQLKCVITLTEELAMAQAARADKELRAGKDRGPLHGIPWGAKDLLDTKGILTTWGAAPFKDRVAESDATVVTRLEEAGAVLVAKLSLGALAMGDRWFGGRTRNPWDPKKGSSGSSAGPASAVAAGLVPFALGSETLGSIISPCTRCGATGLRPTFGRVSRHGAMPLSWTMDKIGPIARNAMDCAVVLEAIAGADGQDDTAVDRPLSWNFGKKLKDLRIGFVPKEFGRRKDTRGEAVLATLKDLGARLVPVTLPTRPLRDLLIILNAESAAAFDDLTRNGGVRELVAQGRRAWPNQFRSARFIPAVEYLRASRIRTLVMRDMAGVMGKLDVLVAPTFSSILVLTNLTGHPAVVMPDGFRDNGTPTSITFIGSLFGEANLVAVAAGWQAATAFHEKRPPLTG